MSTNAYRQTEPFFRRLEHIIDLSTKGAPQDFLVSSEEWQPSTYAVNLRFATYNFLQSDWPSTIDRQLLRERYEKYLYHVVEPTMVNKLKKCVVGWKLRQSRPVNAPISSTTHEPPPSVKLPYEYISGHVTKMTSKQIPLTTELLTSVVMCLQQGCIEHAIPLWGEVTQEHQGVVEGTGVHLTAIVDPVSKLPYVLVN